MSQVAGTTPAGDAEAAVAVAEALLRAALAEQTAAERAHAERLARLMEDPHGKELTVALADQAFRSHRAPRIADQLRHLLERYGAPRYMEWWERAALSLGAVMSHYLPSLVVPPIIARLRHETESVILPGEEEDLRPYLAERRRDGTRLNLNQLGEAILGEGEARRRLDAYFALLARDDVEYISVKISSIASQIDLVAFPRTVALIKERLRPLYRQALAHVYVHPDGRPTPKFVNLDMEEYRDLDLTLAAFREVLGEREFVGLRAGIVLQAYLPDSHRAQRELTAWAMERVRGGGAPIKLRIVKGANLAMEREEAAVHGWPQAPYPTKREVDASYKRLVEYGCRPEHARAVHLGVASHNLFDIGYAMVLRDRRGIGPWVEFEMLEGMANHQARAVKTRAGGLLLYAPVVRAEDFASAIAYLVRRLDENTAPENFLRHVFGLEPGSPAWTAERERFLEAMALRDEVSERPRRTQDRRREELATPKGALAPGPFANDPDTDWSTPANRAWIQGVVERWRETVIEPVPLQVSGATVTTGAWGQGRDPSRPGRVAYRYALAGRDEVARALDAGRRASADWAVLSPADRGAILRACADELGRRRGDLIGAMMLDGAKAVPEADPEVSEAIDFARYYAGALDLEESLARGRMEPLGLVVVAPPWNFPLSIPASGVLAALMAGNAVILKPAPEAVLVAWHLVQALWDAGVPREALQFLPCPEDAVGRELITAPEVAAVILTGSASTARLFMSWRPDLALFAETSGKNSVIVTALADRDQAVRDVVRSAFGHNGQKCSAASLAVCEAEVYDDPAFRRQLADAAASLPVGSAWDLASRVTPLTQPPGPELRRALTSLDEGEAWLLEPRPDAANPDLWSPGIKLGVRPGSFFHQTECFGPVLGLMRAEDLEEAIAFANTTPFGLTSGLQSLDDREIARWQERIEAGNLYVNRHITGAVVRRQPFGGWKRSSFGPGAKAGGPNYVFQLARWHEDELPPGAEMERADGSAVDKEPTAGAGTAADLLSRCLSGAAPREAAALRASAASYARAWREHFGREHDPSQVLGERNVFRYRTCRAVLVRGASGLRGRTPLAQALLAAAICGVPASVSLPPGSADGDWLEAAGVPVSIETDAALATRLEAEGAPERLRLLGRPPDAVLSAAHRAGVTVIDAPVLAIGRLELRWYMREQTLAHVIHRYGNIPSSSPGT